MKVMNPLTEITLACAVLVSSARAAISPAIDGNTWTFTVASGVTETYSTALSGAVDVVKDGAGRLVLDTASTGFAGEVVVKAGTLQVSDKDALGGTSVPISVEDGGRRFGGWRHLRRAFAAPGRRRGRRWLDSRTLRRRNVAPARLPQGVRACRSVDSP